MLPACSAHFLSPMVLSLRWHYSGLRFWNQLDWNIYLTWRIRDGFPLHSVKPDCNDHYLTYFRRTQKVQSRINKQAKQATVQQSTAQSCCRVSFWVNPALNGSGLYFERWSAFFHFEHSLFVSSPKGGLQAQTNLSQGRHQQTVDIFSPATCFFPAVFQTNTTDQVWWDLKALTGGKPSKIKCTNKVTFTLRLWWVNYMKTLGKWDLYLQDMYCL